MLLLLACNGEPGAAPLADNYVGDATFTVVKPEPLEPELVGLSLVGLTVIESDGTAVLAAADELDAFDLVMVLSDWSGPGTYIPSLVRYRKGQQHLVDDQVECEVEVGASGGSFWCEGLHEEGQEAPWSIVDGSFSDEARPVLRNRNERFVAEGYRFGLQVESDTGVQTHEDGEVVVVPFRGTETWVLMDDGVDGHPDDVMFRLSPETGRLTVHKRARSLAAEGVTGSLDFESETSIEVSIQGGEVQEGTALSFVVWEDLHDEPEELVLTIR